MAGGNIDIPANYSNLALNRLMSWCETPVMKMPFLEDLGRDPGTLWGVPEGADAMALHLARSHGGRAVHIAVDDAGLARMAASLGILGVGRENILEFSAWDCLPYDRISPGGVLTGKRLHCLAELATHADGHIVLTTINAWLQRTPPRSCLLHRCCRSSRVTRSARPI